MLYGQTFMDWSSIRHRIYFTSPNYECHLALVNNKTYFDYALSKTPRYQRLKGPLPISNKSTKVVVCLQLIGLVSWSHPCTQSPKNGSFLPAARFNPQTEINANYMGFQLNIATVNYDGEKSRNLVHGFKYGFSLGHYGAVVEMYPHKWFNPQSRVNSTYIWDSF